MDTASPQRRAERLGSLGAGFGYCGAAFAVLVVTAVTGNGHALLTVGLPFLVLSLALWLFTVLATLGARHEFGPRTRAATTTQIGSLLTSLGILLLAAGEFVLPALLEEPGIRRLLTATGSVTDFPAWQGWLVLTAGTGLLAWPVWRLLARTPG